MDAFVSWTGRDREVKNVLVEKLRAEGITCWDSEEYCTSDFSQECIEAIKQSGVFIVIISDASMQTGYVKNEVITARKLEEAGRLNILVYKITDSPYTDDFEFQLNHISFVTGNMVQRREGLRGDSGIDVLVTRAKRLLQRRKEGNPEKPFRVALPQVEGWQLSGGTGYFVENSRNDILEAMDAAFAQGNTVVLTEFVGFGKRSVIRKYLATHPDRFSAAVLVDNQCGSLRNFLLSGLRFSNLNQALFEELEGNALIDAKLRQLEKLGSDTLLVIPDLELPEDRELYLRLLGLRCRIILLTQGSADGCSELFPVIRVGKMEDPYLNELFFHHYTRAYEEEKEQLKAPLEDFFDQIGGHTKTVELTAAVLNRDMGIMPEQVPDYLSLQGAGGMALKDRILSQLSHMFVMEQLTHSQIQALVIAACLAVPYLSEQHFRQLLAECGGKNWQEIMELDDRRWLDLDPKNRTVAMEPLVAQIVLQRFAQEQETLLRCLRYVENAFLRQMNAAEVTGFLASNMARIEHFFRLLGLTTLAELAEAEKLELWSQDNKEGLAAAMKAFREEYPEAECSEDPAYLEFSDLWQELCYRAQYFARSHMLPLAKMWTSELGTLWADYSVDSQHILKRFSDQTEDNPIDFENLFGMDREEFGAWLGTMRQSMLQAEDEEDVSLRFMAEAVETIDAIYRRNYQATLQGMENVLLCLEEMPELLYDEGMADMFLSCAGMLVNVYIVSKAYMAATRLLEKVLAYPTRSTNRILLKKLYISALRKMGQYDETLYRMHEELLQDLEECGSQIFEDRREQLREKQKWGLIYADDLSAGGECLRAKEVFARACKGELLLPNEMVITAWNISEELIRSGEFEVAQQFLVQHFPAEKQAILATVCDEEHQKYLSQITDLLALGNQVQNDFEADEDPSRHISYYHEYSRKNNSLLDRKYNAVADRAMEFDFSELTNEQITEHARALRKRSARENLLRLAPEAFALASEAGQRVLGYRHHYVQYIGAAAMADGKIAEILNGEGKTYTIVAVAFLQWVFGKTVFVVDESPYLTQRNHNWMQGVYQLLGMESRYIHSSREMKKASADVYYITLRNLMFAYLDHEINDQSTRSGFKLDVAIIDEIDTVLVDQAKQKFRSANMEKDREALPLHEKVWSFVEKLELYGEDFTLREKTVTLLPAIYPKMERAFGISWEDMEQLPRIQRIESLMKIAIVCRFVYEENKDYFIHRGIPVKEDKTRGTFNEMLGSYEYFLCRQNELDCEHAKKELETRWQVCNSICVKDLFRKFSTVCGTTATAVSFQREFREIYDLDYVAIPPHSPVIRQDTQSPFYLSARNKDRAILEMVAEKQKRGQPVLLITQSVAESEKYHRLLKRAGIPNRLLNAKNAEEAADILSTAGTPGSVLVANALVSRGADIRLGGNPERQTLRTLVEMGTDISGLEEFLYRLPTREQKESELYKKYYSILEQNKRLTARQRQEVVEAGGLCVIGTGFFPEPRNEQQTRGRSGRQGEVGESCVFCSVEDEGLKSLMSAAYLEMLLAQAENMEYVDTGFLRSALKNAQKNIHKAMFAEIRSINTEARYIEKYRNDFVGLGMELQEGLVEPDEVIEKWADDKFIRKQLLALQQGQTRSESVALNLLWKQDVSLRNAKGMRTQRMLKDAFLKELQQRFSSLTEEALEEVKLLCLRKGLIKSWEEYIEIVEDATQTLKSPALEKYLEQEKDRLMRQVVETLLQLTTKNSNG